MGRKQTIFLLLCLLLCLGCHEKVSPTFEVDLPIPIKTIKTIPQLRIPPEMILSCGKLTFKTNNHHVQIKHLIYSINRLNGKKNHIICVKCRTSICQCTTASWKNGLKKLRIDRTYFKTIKTVHITNA